MRLEFRFYFTNHFTVNAVPDWTRRNMGHCINAEKVVRMLNSVRVNSRPHATPSPQGMHVDVFSARPMF